MPRHSETPVAILGAGLTGMSAAYHLGQAGVPYRIFEKLPRPGGHAVTIEEDGYRFVTISGTATIVEDHATTQADIYALARRYNPDFKKGDYPVFATQTRLTYRISIDNVIANGFEE